MLCTCGACPPRHFVAIDICLPVIVTRGKRSLGRPPLSYRRCSGHDTRWRLTTDRGGVFEGRRDDGSPSPPQDRKIHVESTAIVLRREGGRGKEKSNHRGFIKKSGAKRNKYNLLWKVTTFLVYTSCILMIDRNELSRNIEISKIHGSDTNFENFWAMMYI